MLMGFLLNGEDILNLIVVTDAQVCEYTTYPKANP